MANPTSKVNLVVNGVTTQLDVHDANAVDLSSNQTVGGNKEFTGTTTAHDVIPSATDTYNFGTSTNKWKLFNGINPGALSLPSNSYVNVDTTNWDLACSYYNGFLGSFTPTADGWLMLQINNGGTSEVNFWVIGGVLRINNKSTFNDTNSNNFNMIIVPVTKGNTYNIYGMASEYVAGRTIGYCRFAPCQGNV